MYITQSKPNCSIMMASMIKTAVDNLGINELPYYLILVIIKSSIIYNIVMARTALPILI